MASRMTELAVNLAEAVEHVALAEERLAKYLSLLDRGDPMESFIYAKVWGELDALRMVRRNLDNGVGE